MDGLLIQQHFIQLAKSENLSDAETYARVKDHLLEALRGFFRTIALSPQGALQDTLRLLSLWFKYGCHPEVEEVLMEGFEMVRIDNWLQVLPQIIARIHTSVKPVRRLIHELLMKVGRAHPQPLVYSLSVASKSLVCS
jgi:serine/threonine-protein kinase mTOR